VSTDEDGLRSKSRYYTATIITFLGVGWGPSIIDLTLGRLKEVIIFIRIVMVIFGFR